MLSVLLNTLYRHLEPLGCFDCKYSAMLTTLHTTYSVVFFVTGLKKKKKGGGEGGAEKKKKRRLKNRITRVCLFVCVVVKELGEACIVIILQLYILWPSCVAYPPSPEFYFFEIHNYPVQRWVVYAHERARARVCMCVCVNASNEKGKRLLAVCRCIKSFLLNVSRARA